MSEAPPVLVIDPSPGANAHTLAPIVAAGCKTKTVASMNEALDAFRAFAPALVMADVNAAPPRPDRLGEAARHAGAIPLVLIGPPETSSQAIEQWSNLGATDLVMRPLRLYDVQLRLAAAQAGPRTEAKRPRRVLLASDDVLDLRRLDALLQLNGFHVLPVDLTGRAPEIKEEFDVLAIAARDTPARQLLHQLRNRSGLEKLPAVVLSAGPELPGEPNLHACLHVNAPADDVVRAVSGDRRIMPQLRAHQRVPFFAAVEFRETGNPYGRWLAGYSSNLSPGGVFIRSLAAGRAGSVLEVRIHLAASHERIEGTGVIAWANSWGARSGFHFSIGMGLQFVAMSPVLLQRIRELCDPA